MPQLRSGARTGRRPAVASPVTDTNKGKARVNKATGRAARKRAAWNKVDNIACGDQGKEIVAVDGGGGERNVDAVLRETASLKVGEDNNRVEEVKEVVGEKKMDECDSGGNGSGKGLGAEDEGSTTPIPERVQVGGSPAYRIEKKLGKGGFGQVHVGRRINPPNPNEINGLGAVVSLSRTHSVADCEMNLRPRKKQPFSGFTKAEVQKMEQLLDEFKDQQLDKDFLKNLAKDFNCSCNRVGKPILKWTEIQNWFKTKQENFLPKETSSDEAKKPHVIPDAIDQSRTTENPKIPEGQKDQVSPNLEFEARSSTDGAWYDVDRFLSHRFLSSGEIEVRVGYVGFGSKYDEWVNVKTDVRERSVALDHSECQNLKVGDPVVCFQERRDAARYYDAHVVDIQRRLHDVRGCRCLFLIRYDHDCTQERVRLKRLCCRPNLLTRLDNS